MDTAADRLRRARIDAGFESGTDATRRFGWPQSTYLANENGTAPFSFKRAKDYGKAFRVRAQWLYDGAGPMRDHQEWLPILGYIGANPDGSILFAEGQGTGDHAPAPPSGSGSTNVVEVKGYSMPFFADDGSLIYYGDRMESPSAEMIGQILFCETMEGHVLLKRVQRGAAQGLFNLESIVGPTLHDVALRWVAIITDIVPPLQARRIIRRSMPGSI